MGETTMNVSINPVPLRLVREGDDICLMLDDYYIATINDSGILFHKFCNHVLSEAGIAADEEGCIKIRTE
jgi:hypothetical protein